MATHKSASSNGKNQINFGIGFSIDQASYNQTLQSLKKLQNITQDDITGKAYGSKGMQSQIDRIKKSASEVQKIWKQAFNSDLGVLNIQKFNSLLNASGLNLKKLGKDWSSVEGLGANALRNLTSATLTANMNLKRTDSLVNKIGTTFLNTIKWTFASSVINSFTGSLQQSFGYIKSLDSSLNDIRIVTGKSADEMSKFAVKANEAAKALGKQTTDYTNAALIYYQQGLNEEESNTLAETTLKVSNITGQSAGTVSEEITAVMNGYQLGANQVEAAFDSLAAVAATTASDLSEISTGMSKVASTANMLGVPLDSLNAQLATIVSVTRQAPESVGTALKTIYARMNDLKLGKSDEDGIQLGDVSGSLEKMGIHILDEKNNLRDLGTVINEVAASWKTWTDEQKIAMAEVMAGKRQYNNLIALFDNWDMYTKALNTSLNAQGTIAKQNGIYLDSLAAHMNSLKAAQEGVMDSFFDSDTFKGFIDFGTSALGVIEKIIDALGGGGTILGNIASIAGRVFSNQIARELSNIVINIQNYRYNLQQLQGAMQTLRNIQTLNSELKDDGIGTITRLKQEVMSFGNLVTPEEQNQANVIIQKVNSLYQERDAWKQAYEAGREAIAGDAEYIEMQKLATQTEVARKAAIDDSIKKIKERQDSYNKDIAFLQKLQNINKMSTAKKAGIEIDSDQIGNLVNDFDKLKNSTGIFTKDLGFSDKEVEGFYKTLSNLTEKTKIGQKQIVAISAALKGMGIASNKATEGIKALRGAEKYLGENFTNKVKAAQAEWNNFVSSLRTTAHIQQITKLVSTVGQLSMGFSTLSNIGDIINNDDISQGQRLFQVLTNIGFVIPQIATGIAGLKSTMAGLGMIKIPSAEQLAQFDFSDRTGLTKEEIKGFDIDKLSIEELKKHEEGLKLLNLAESENIDITNLKTGADLKDALSTKAATEADKEATAAAKARAAAFNIVAMAATVAIAIISAVSKAIIKSKEQEAQAAKKQVQNSYKRLEQTQEQAKKINQLATSYNELYEKYQKNQITQENMRKSTYDLCKQYGDYNLIIKALAGSYDDLAQSIKEAQKAQNDAVIKNAKDVIDTTTTAARKQVAVQNAYHPIRTKGSGDNLSLTGVPLETLGVNPQVFHSTIEFIDKLEKLIGKGNVSVDSTGALNVDVTSKEANQNIAKNFNELQNLFVDFRNKTIPNWINGLTDFFNATEESYSKAAASLEKSKQASLSNISIDNANEAAIRSRIGQQGIKDSYEAFGATLADMISAAMEQKLFDTVEEAKDWALKELSDIEALRKEQYLTRINDSIPHLSDELQNYLKSLSEKDLQLIIAGEIEILGQKGPDALKDALQILKQNTSFEDTSLAIKVRADVAKGGELKEDDIKSLTAQTGVETLADSLDSGSVLDKLDRYNEAIDVAKQKTLDFLSTTQKEAQTKIDEYTDKIEELKKKRESLYNIPGLSDEVAAIDEQIDAYKRLQDRLQQIKEGLTLEQIDDSVFSIIRDEIDAIVTKAETLKSAAEMIGEGFKVAADDVREFASLYPELLDQATYTADGQMILNQQVVQDFVDKKREQINADAESKKAQLNSQIAIYEARVRFDDAKIKALEEYLTTDKSAKETQMDIQKAYGEYTQDVATALGTTQEELTSNGLINMETLGEGVHNVLANIAKQYEQLNRYIPLALIGKAPSSVSLSGAAKSGVSAEAFAQSNSVSNIRDRKADYDQVFEDYRNILAQREADIDHLNELRAALSGVESSQRASLAALGRVAAGQAGKASGKSGGGSSKDPETRQYKDYSDKAIKDERDIYLQINRIIENTQRTLEKLEKTTEKLVGSQMVAALQQQNKILAQQAANYQKKADIAREEQDRLAKELQQYGFTFGDNGELNNYNTAYTANASRINSQIQAIQDEVNAAIAAYNTLDAASQQAQKEQLEALEKGSEARVQVLNKEWETITNGVSKYNEAMDTVYESQKAAAQANEKQYENMISLFEKKIKVTVDFNDAKREFNKFVKDIVNNFSKETAKGLSVLRDASIADLSTFLDDTNSDANTYLEGLTKAQGALERMQASGSTYDDETGFSQEKALEFGQQYSKSLIESLTNAKESVDELFDTWLEGWDRIEQQLDNQVKKYDFINDQLEHGKKLVTLLNGDKAYDQLDKYYDEQIKNDNSRLDMLKKQKQFIENSMKREQELLKQYPEGTRQYEQAMKRYETLQNSWMDNINELNSAIEDSVERLLEKYGNLWDKILTESKNSLTGGMDFDNASEEWQLVKKNADLYLDDINKGFETEKFNLAIEKALADTQGNIKAQKALNDLRDKELTKLKEKERITQYDVDRANALLTLEQKRIALEEAQNNKSKLRLRRDSQGNYSYQYTADEEDVGDKRTDYLNAMQNVYNMDRQAYRNNLDMMQAATNEYYSKMSELREAYLRGDDTALERMRILNEQYQQYITSLARENTDIRTNLTQSAGESAHQVYKDDETYFGSMIDYEVGYLDTKLVPGWDGAIQKISDKVNGEGGFIKTTQGLTQGLTELTDAYKKKLDETSEAAGRDLGAIDEGLDQIDEDTAGILSKVEQWISDNNTLITTLQNEKTELDKIIDSANTYVDVLGRMSGAAADAISRWQALQGQINQAIRAAQLARQEAAKPVVSAPSYVGAVSSPGEAAANPNSGGGDGGGSNNGGSGPSAPAPEPEPPQIATVQDDPQGVANSVGLFVNGRLVKIQGYTPQYLNTHIPDSAAAERDLQNRKKNVREITIQELRNYARGQGYDVQFASGGYTGQWANGDKDGRLAMLHQKELVLNADDTKNILSAVDIVRTMKDALNFITNDSSLPNFAKNLASTSSSSQLEQNVHITATFPNVVNSNEIQIALENLTSKASQYINRR